MGFWLITSLDCAIEHAMSGILLQHHVVEVIEGVIGGDNIHLTRVKSRSGDQCPSTVKSIYSDLHHGVKVIHHRCHWHHPRRFGRLSPGRSRGSKLFKIKWFQKFHLSLKKHTSRISLKLQGETGRR